MKLYIVKYITYEHIWELYDIKYDKKLSKYDINMTCNFGIFVLVSCDKNIETIIVLSTDIV